jgi:chromosome segregation ATPase
MSDQPVDPPAPYEPEREYEPGSPKNALRSLRRERDSVDDQINNLQGELDTHTDAAKKLREEIKELQSNRDGLTAAMDAINALPGDPVS